MRTFPLLILIGMISLSITQDVANTVLSNINTYSRKNLEKLALAAEKYNDEKLGIKMKFGGLHDYIFKIDSQRIKNIIRDYIINHPELNEKLDQIAEIEAFPVGMEFLASLEHESLSNLQGYAYACKALQNKLSDSFSKMVYKLNEEALIKSIRNCASENKELANGSKIHEYLSETHPIEIPLDKLQEFLLTLEKDTLVSMLIVADEYDRDMKLRFGGAADYAFRLSKEEMIIMLMQLANKYPELLHRGYFMSLFEQYEEQLAGAYISQVSKLLETLKKSQLISVALRMEEYYKTKRQIFVLGGLHDYIYSLSESEIKGIIRDFLADYPELRSVTFLDSLLKNPDFTIRSAINGLPAEDLRVILLALNKFDEEKQNKEVEGREAAIKAYDREDLLAEIFDMLNEYPELNKSGEIAIQVRKYLTSK